MNSPGNHEFPFKQLLIQSGRVLDRIYLECTPNKCLYYRYPMIEKCLEARNFKCVLEKAAYNGKKARRNIVAPSRRYHNISYHYAIVLHQ